MKKTLLFLIVVVQFGSLNAQPQKIDNLCYNEEYSETIIVFIDLNLSSLTVLDKLKFHEKSYCKKHFLYFNRSGYATHDIQFVSQDNIFPKWYSHPSLIRSDESGTKSYFNGDSPYLAGGWAGGLKSHTELGEYITDRETGNKYLKQDYSSIAAQYYQLWHQQIFNDGFLPAFVFTYPTREYLDILRDQGFNVASFENVIKVGNDSINLIWDTQEKVFVRQDFESGIIVNTVEKHYQYSDEFKEFLVHKQISKTPGMFDDGQCYETISQTVYSNYSGSCKQVDDSKKSSIETINENSISYELDVFPNPANNKISIQFPASELKTWIQISNLEGEVMMLRQISENVTFYDVDLSAMPSGIYLIKCIQGNSNYSSKFVKL